MVTHSNILAWKISWTEEPGGLQSMGSRRVRHNLETKEQSPQHSNWALIACQLAGDPVLESILASVFSDYSWQHLSTAGS